MARKTNKAVEKAVEKIIVPSGKTKKADPKAVPKTNTRKTTAKPTAKSGIIVAKPSTKPGVNFIIPTPPTSKNINFKMNQYGELLIDGKNEGQHFKTGDDGSTGIRFDAQFWKNCFVGDSIKDGATRPILEGFLPASFNGEARSFTAEGIKDLSKEMITRLEMNGLLIKAEITRLTHYKEGLGSDPRLQTQISTAFPEGYPIYVDKDCGLDPAYFLPTDICRKSCNIASDIIDPHSSKTDDCAERFPKAGDTIELDKSVFEFLQYPCECSLKAKTSIRKGEYDNMEFLVDGKNLLSPDNYRKFFSGNATKNAAFKKNLSKQEYTQLCTAKYSGDTLQSYFQKLFEILLGGNRTFVISTCDSIVSLRSYALNGSFIYICKDVRQEKITQIYIWRKELGNPVTLTEVFNKEKAKILAEYDCLIALVRGIENPATPLRNIFVAGSNTTYKFTPEFYRRIVNDLNTIKNAINTRITIPMGATVAVIAGQIRMLRLFKVNDFLKLNGPRGHLYTITLATKYTKGNLTQLVLDNTKPSADGIDKRSSQSFFEHATQSHSVPVLAMGGSMSYARAVMSNDNSVKSNARAVKSNARAEKNPCNMENIDEVLNTFFNMNHYNKRGEPNLHRDIVVVFKEKFTRKIPENDPTYVLKFFDCFSDVINSFATLDIDKDGNRTPPGNEYYSEASFALLIDNYFSEKEEELELEAREKIREAEEEIRLLAEREAEARKQADEARKLLAEREAEARKLLAEEAKRREEAEAKRLIDKANQVARLQMNANSIKEKLDQRREQNRLAHRYNPSKTKTNRTGSRGNSKRNARRSRNMNNSNQGQIPNLNYNWMTGLSSNQGQQNNQGRFVWNYPNNP